MADNRRHSRSPHDEAANHRDLPRVLKLSKNSELLPATAELAAPTVNAPGEVEKYSEALGPDLSPAGHSCFNRSKVIARRVATSGPLAGQVQ